MELALSAVSPPLAWTLPSPRPHDRHRYAGLHDRFPSSWRDVATTQRRPPSLFAGSLAFADLRPLLPPPIAAASLRHLCSVSTRFPTARSASCSLRPPPPSWRTAPGRPSPPSSPQWPHDLLCLTARHQLSSPPCHACPYLCAAACVPGTASPARPTSLLLHRASQRHLSRADHTPPRPRRPPLESCIHGPRSPWSPVTLACRYLPWAAPPSALHIAPFVVASSRCDQ